MKVHADRLQQARCRSAFALVEVVMAIGIISFCLVAILGLLSVGSIGLKDAREQAAGGIVLEQISNDLRLAATNSAHPLTYTGLGVCGNLNWTLGGSATSCNYMNLSIEGDPTSSQGDQRLVAHVEMTPPSADASVAGKALVSIAWPKQASWVSATSRWTNAENSLSTYVIFLPRP